MDSLKNGVNRLSFLTLLNIYYRSFFFQGSFSAKHRQNLGFAFCLEPVGKKLWKNDEDRIQFFLRHTDDYNGNPFMAPLVLGVVAKMEESVFEQDGTTVEDIRRFKKAVGPATGSSGDRLFWSNLRPFGILLGITASLSFGIWGILVFLAAFMIPTLVLKWHWLNTGYRLGPKVVYEIKNYKIDYTEQIMEIAGSLTVAFVTTVYTARMTHTSNTFFLGVAALFLISFFMLKKYVPLHIVFPLALFIAVFLSMIS
jgi:mannose/fructose/N-acetylgalactosamine-specific phosphotransferase system component IID